MKAKQKESSFLLHVAIVVIIVSLFFIGAKLTGHATETGVINITIVSSAAINLTTDFIDFGGGAVDSLASFAYLDTEGGVTGGNWSAVSQGFLLENIGNVNVTFNVSGDKTAATFLGGSSPQFRYKISDNESNSCLGNGASTYAEITTGEQPGCSIFRFADSNDTVEIDFNLTVPYDSNTGTLTTTITINATAL